MNNKKNFNIDVKIGILHTVADAIYATLPGKSREAVANAKDNDATWIIIYIDPTLNKLYFLDNGNGITKERFNLIFESIGYGLEQKDNSKLSYFGLGLLSIFQLGKRVKIVTHPKGSQEINSVDIQTKEIFEDNNKSISISDITNFIDYNLLMDSHDVFQEPDIKDFICNNLSFDIDQGSYTYFIIEDVEKDDIDSMYHSNFKNQLCKILPIQYDDNDLFLNRFSDKNALDNILHILKDDQYCPTIDVYFGIKGDVNDNLENNEKNIIQLFKYFPIIKSDIDFDSSNVFYGEGSNFAYYIVHTIAQEMQDTKEDQDVGLSIRNQNFLVKGSDFLEKGGPGRKHKIIDQPLRNWVYGEIFHKNMNSFLTVSRTDFLYERKEFTYFRDEVENIVKDVNITLREIWKKKKKVEEDLVEPFIKISTPEGSFSKIEKRLNFLLPANSSKDDIKINILNKLSKQRSIEIEDEAYCMDKILLGLNNSYLLYNDQQSTVELNPILVNTPKDYNISWDKTNKKVVISLSPNLFASKKIIFFSETYDLIFVFKNESDKAVSFNIANKKIYINPFNKWLKRGSITLLELLIVLEVAESISKTIEEYKCNIIEIIIKDEKEFPDVSEYITPLGDILQRHTSLKR